MADFNQDFITFIGDTVKPIFTVVQSDGITPVDISAVIEIVWTAQRNPVDGPSLTKKKSLGQIVFMPTGTNGQFQVLITAADTALLSGWYQHTASLTDPSNNITTVTVGRMGVNPTDWTWNPSSVGVESLYTVRQLIGDYVQSDQLLTDSQIRWAISQYSNEWLAGAECARDIAMNFARQVDVGEGPMKKNYSQRSKQYYTLARDLEQRGFARGGTTIYAGGISIGDKTNQVTNPDRVPPNFLIAMHDNLLPESPVGLQTDANLGAAAQAVPSGDDSVFNGP